MAIYSLCLYSGVDHSKHELFPHASMFHSSISYRSDVLMECDLLGAILKQKLWGKAHYMNPKADVFPSKEILRQKHRLGLPDKMITS